MATAIGVQNAAGWKLTLAPAPTGGGGGVAGFAQAVASAAVPAAGSEVKLNHTLFRADVMVAKGLGLDGGRVKIVVERLPFRMLQNILAAYEKAGDTKTESKAKGTLRGVLKLFWRVGLPYPGLDEAADLIQGALGTGEAEADVGARFAVTSLSVDSDKGGYRLTIEGVDAAWHTLSTEHVKDPTPLAKPDDIRALCSQLGVDTGAAAGGLALPDLGAIGGATAGAAAGAAVGAAAGTAAGAVGGAAAGASAKSLVTKRERVLERLSQFEAAVVEQSKAEGLGGYLIDNGRLLYGDDVVATFKRSPNDLSGGLHVIGVRAQGSEATDHSGSEQAFTLQLRGDAGIKPGQVVKFRYKKQSLVSASTGLGYADAAIGLVTDPLGLGAEGDPVCLYVRAVRHRQSATAGFVTEVDGIGCGSAAPEIPGRKDKPSAASGATSVDSAAGVISTAIDQRRPKVVDVGQLLAFRSKTTDNAPGQTEDVSIGLDPTRGGVQAFRTAPVERTDPQRADAVPYVTPFAWGPYGLVLPRYPGMRLALLRPDGRPEEALDVGALWWSGQDGNAGAGPSEAKDGDYWLILPVDPQSQTSGKEAPEAPKSGKAAHDLIDQQGRRFVQLRELTVRVGEWAIKAPSDRPADAAAKGGLRIEGKGGKAVIEIDQAGNIKIETPQKLELKADAGITLTSNNVTVQIKDGAMDVT